MLAKELKRLGLTENEITIYLALFDLGKTKAAALISHTKLHRNIVYTTLEELNKRGLITKTEIAHVFHFVANSPEHLLEELEEKKRIAHNVVHELKKRQESSPREVAVYEGIEGFKRMREKSLAQHEDVYIIGASKLDNIPGVEDYLKEYNKKRVRKGIEARLLFDRATSPQSVAWRSNLQKTKVRALPFGAELPIWIEFYGDELGIGLPGDEPLVFSIKSHEAVQGFKTFFDHFWNQKAATFQGNEGFQQAYGDIIRTLRPGEEVLALGTFEFDKEFAELVTTFHHKRAAAGINARFLLNADAAGMAERFGKVPRTQIKFLQRDIVTPAVVLIYGEKIMLAMSKSRTFVIVEDADISSAFRKYFDFFWAQATGTATPAIK